MSEKPINYEFKTLQALGMLCIISGHFASGLLSLHALFPYDTFHMPMFVFISGYFFKPSNADSIANVAQFIKRKIKRLIIPYYLWNLFYCAIAHILNRYTIMNIEGGIHSAVDFFLEPFRGVW